MIKEMNRLKKFGSLILAASMCLSLAACGGAGSSSAAANCRTAVLHWPTNNTIVYPKTPQHF